MKILCFGDSITFGEIDTKNGGWVDHLKDDFIRQYADSIRQEVTLYNLGICGETTDGLSTRFSIEFNARLVKGQKSLVIFSYGINDIVIHKNNNIVPKKYFIRNLKSCVDTAKSKDACVILSSLTPISDSIDGEVNQHDKLRYSKDIDIYNTALQKFASENNCFYLEVYSEFEKCKNQFLSKDGIHPNSEGHLLIYRRIKELLENEIDPCCDKPISSN